MKNAIFFAGILFVLSGCVSNINNAKLNIAIDAMPKTNLLPLKNSNDDVSLYYIGAHVMEESGFLSADVPAYGYYAVEISASNDIVVPYFFIFGWVNCLTLYLPSLIGFPTDLEQFDLTAHLYLFDSAGALIKDYKYSDSFNKLAGLYYGQNPHKKASVYYSRLFKKIIELANVQSAEINYLLAQAGPITNDNMQAAHSAMNAYLSANKP
jgi:hypothetical protein